MKACLKAQNKKNGFTLIEVLMALAILGLVLGGIMSGARQYINLTSELKKRTYAQWVAHNEMVKSMMDTAIGEGVSQGKIEFNRQNWQWIRTIKSIDTPMMGQVLQIKIEVSLPTERLNEKGLVQASLLGVRTP